MRGESALQRLLSELVELHGCLGVRERRGRRRWRRRCEPGRRDGRGHRGSAEAEPSARIDAGVGGVPGVPASMQTSADARAADALERGQGGQAGAPVGSLAINPIRVELVRIGAPPRQSVRQAWTGDGECKEVYRVVR